LVVSYRNYCLRVPSPTVRLFHEKGQIALIPRRAVWESVRGSCTQVGCGSGRVAGMQGWLVDGYFSPRINEGLCGIGAVTHVS